MKRRSMRSFQLQIQSPQKLQFPREATACRLPVLTSASQWRCGRHTRKGRPCSWRRRFSCKSGAMRTANTPAFSSGRGTKLAMSPAANTRGSLTLCRCWLTWMKPRSSSARPVPCSQAGPPACVTHSTSSASSVRPLLVTTQPGCTCCTSAFRCTSTLRSRSTDSMCARTRGGWVGITSALALISTKRRFSGLRPRARSSRRRRYCIDSTISTPAAPPPTTAIVRRWRDWRTFSSRASQRWLNSLMGLTGMARACAPSARRCGVAPMLIESRS